MLAFAAVVSLVACGGPAAPTPPGGDATREVEGVVDLPAGHGLDPATLVVTTSLGVYHVSGDGTFVAEVFGSGATELGVQASTGELLLLGVATDDSVELSVASTAEALLYYLVGGMWLPEEQQDAVRALLADVEHSALIEVELKRILQAGGNGLAQADDQLLTAIEAAHDAIFGDAALATELAALGSTRTAGPGGTVPPFGTAVTTTLGAVATEAFAPAAAEAGNVIIEPTTMRAGALVLHDPAGAGVVVQNHVRRPAALLAYETAWVDADGAEHPVDPPELRGSVDVPSTGQLELLNALLDVVTGDAPWAPVLSESLALPVRDGASRSIYRLVLLGPSTSGVQWHIWEDERFSSFHDDWNDVIFDKSVDLFLNELLMPLVEVYGLGSMAKFDAGKLSAMRDRVRFIHDKHMQQLGVFLTQGQVGYANALRLLMQELIDNRTYRLDMLDVVRDALEESDKNKAAIEAMEKRLASRASASAIAAAVQTVLVAGDVAKIMYDLAGVPSTADWTAVVSAALFFLSPGQAVVTQGDPSVRFTVLPKGEASGDYVYRWSTSGSRGHITDLLQDEADVIVTTSKEVWYFHDRPLDISDDDYDTVGVEVFEVEPGQTTVPPGAEPIARMAAEIRGDDRNVDHRIELNYGTTSTKLYTTQYACAEMYLRFAAEPGAEDYTVLVRGVGGQGQEANTNQDFRLRGPDHDLFIDPDATFDGKNVEEGYTPDWHGVCLWKVGDDYASQPITVSAFYDRANDEYLVHLFTLVDHPHDTLSIESVVPLWYDWVSGATFEVVPGY